MNLLNIKTNITPILARSVVEFNKLVELYKPRSANKLITSKQGNLTSGNARILPACKTFKRNNCFEFHFLSAEDGWEHVRVLYGNTNNEERDLDEKVVFNALNFFKIDGKSIFDFIPTDDEEEDVEMFVCPENKDSKYYNYVNEKYVDILLPGAKSIDRNSAFLASAVSVYPKILPFAEKYMRTKEKIKGKVGYNSFKMYDKIVIGYLKRKNRLRAWKKIISNSNSVIHNVRKDIEDKNLRVVLVNTDSVKFIDPSNKYQMNDSKFLGEFKTEFAGADIYAKGVKSYAYRLNGNWTFKQSGHTKLDDVKARSEWTLKEFIECDTQKLKIIKIDTESDLLYTEYDY